MIRSTDTTKIAQEIKQNSRDELPADLAITNDTTNVIAPNSEDNPNTCKKRTPRLTADEEEKSIPVSGKYNVQPADTPSANDIAITRSWIAMIDIQNAKLFKRGVAKSMPE